MHTTDNTTSTAMADLDRLIERVMRVAGQLDKLGAKADANDFLQLIALARRAAQPVALSQVLRDAAKGSFTESVSRLLLDAACAVEPYDATPSPQVAEGAELPGITSREEFEEQFAKNWPSWTKTRDEAGEYTWLRAKEAWAHVQRQNAIAASRRAAGGEASELEFNATRLRNVARLVGLEKAIPEDDATLDGARGSVLGMIAGALSNRATPAPASAGQAAPVPLVAKLTALRNEAEAERQSEADTSRKHICEGMSLAFGAAAILAAQPAEGAGQASANRIKYLEKLVSAYGPKSLQYDIEHPNDGLNSADPDEVQRTARSLAESGGAGQAGQVAACDVCGSTEYSCNGCAKTITTERAAAPADQHKRVIQFALELAEHENDDAAVSFLRAWNSEDTGYLRRNWPDFATHQPSAQPQPEATAPEEKPTT